MSFRDLVENFPAALEAAIAAKCAIAMGAWYLIPVAAVLALAMHESGETTEPSSRQVSLYATQVSTRYPQYSRVRHNGRPHFKYQQRTIFN